MHILYINHKCMYPHVTITQLRYRTSSAPLEGSLVLFSTEWHPPHLHHYSIFWHHKWWFSAGW